MSPFSPAPNSSPTFNKDNPDFKKVGDLKDEPMTEAYLHETLKPFEDAEAGRVQEKARLEQEISEMEQKIELLKNKKRSLNSELSDVKYAVKIPEQVKENIAFVEASELYETEDGNLVASLPDGHPVMRSIESVESQKATFEKLEIGTKNLLEVLRKEESLRQPVDWNPGDVLNSDPRFEWLRDLILFDKDSEQPQKLRGIPGDYLTMIAPEILQMKEGETEAPSVRGYEFFRDYDENGGGFTGVTFFLRNGKEDDLYFVMKNGKRFCIKNVLTDKTYPFLTSYGPDFAGNHRIMHLRDGHDNKIEHKRFIFTNYLFKQATSSASYLYTDMEYKLGRETKLTTDFVEKTVQEGEVLDGIDPDTYYDENTHCLVFNRPLFMPYYRERSGGDFGGYAMGLKINDQAGYTSNNDYSESGNGRIEKRPDTIAKIDF